MIPSFQEVTYW